MFKFKIKIPLVIEQKGNFDSHVFSSSTALKFNFIDLNENYEFEEENENYYIIIKKLIYSDLIQCVKHIEDFLSVLMPVCSLIIQTKHINQHFTHLRLNYKISQMQVLEEEELQDDTFNTEDNLIINDALIISSSSSMKTTLTINFENLGGLVKNYKNDIAFKYILDCYYRALGANDFYTKYYNAFSAIEFIENFFKQDICTNLLLEKSALEKICSDLKENNLILKENKERIIARIKGTIKSATLENRAEKLELIIKNVFKITNIRSGVINFNVTDTSLTSLIKIRNILFHGKNINEEDNKNINVKCLELILLIQNILLKWEEIPKS